MRIILSAFREHPKCAGEAIDAALIAAHQAIVAQRPTKAELAGMRATAIRAGDVFLLCTYGVWEYVDESSMLAALSHESTAAGWLQERADDVVRRGSRGQDNFSALAVFCRAAPEDPDATKVV